MTKWRLILIFFVGSVALRGQTEASLKDRLVDCVDTYLRHINYFMATDTKTKPELPTQFQALFVSGVHISPPFGDATAQWTPFQYGQWLLGFSDNAKLVQEQLRFCKSATYPDVWEIYVLQRFVGAYLEPKPHELPRLGQILSVQVGADGTFLIADIEPMPVSLFHDLDSDHDGIPDRADACPWLAGGLERNGAHPFKPCPKDADGDGTLDKDDKCPNQFGEKEDGGCPKYSESETEVISRIEVVRKSGNDTLDVSRLSLARLPGTIKNLTSLKVLNLNNTFLRNLSSLQNLKLLYHLDWGSNCLVTDDLEQLKYVNQLTQLSIWGLCSGSGIDNLSRLKNLTKLEVLNAESVRLHDISDLKYLTQIKELNLGGNWISDSAYSVLLKLPNLKTLDLSFSGINNIKVLESLHSIERLVLRHSMENGTCMNSFNLDLTKLPHLKELYLGDCRIYNIPYRLFSSWELNCVQELREYQNNPEAWLTTAINKAIKDYTTAKTKFLDLSGLNLTELPPTLIERLKKIRLTHIDLKFNQLKDISAIQELKQLEKLNFEYNGIKNFNLDLSFLPNLKELYLYANPIQNIPRRIFDKWNINCIDYLRQYQKMSEEEKIEFLDKKFKHTINYTGLDLSQSALKSVPNLKKFSSYKELMLSSNQIADISMLQLAELQQLTDLWLNDNKINNIAPLRNLKQLIRLGLSNNQISDISVLRELKQLTQLDLSNNKIQNFNLDLNLLPNLKELNISGNPIQNIPKEVLDKGIEAIRAYQKTKKQ